MSKIIVGIDPGYDRCGVAVIDASAGVGNEELLFSTCIETNKQDDYYNRLEKVGTEVSEILKRYNVDIFAIESLFFNKNQKTATKISELKGILLFLAQKQKLNIFEYTPLQIKMAITGMGRADKRAVYELLPKLIKINKKIKLDDEFDAIACALTASVLVVL